jgi:hypothetical protein
MASNLDYLSPSLQPLEEKAQAYVDAEAILRQAEIALQNEPARQQQEAQAATQFEQRPPTGSFDQSHDELIQRLQNARDELHALHAELLALLPDRNEWVKINLGYGPSRIGAWHVPATTDSAEHYQVRVVH